MSILLPNEPAVIIQGITGKEGQRTCEWLLASGTPVVAGVTPGKGGQEVLGVPVYNTVAEAVSAHPNANASCIYVPPRMALAAAQEAFASGIKLIHIIAEEVPVRDTVLILQEAKKHEARVLGPSSIGIIAPGKAKLGSIGGEDNNQFSPGSIAVISKSGGMSSEISLLLTTYGYGQSTVVGIGGNMIVGTSFADLVPLLEADEQTKAVVVVGEIGGWYEELLAEELSKIPNHKPYLAFVSGRFAETLPQGMSFGHAGAIVDAEVGTRAGKIQKLLNAGAHIIDQPSDMIETLKRLGITPDNEPRITHA
jgi:succinyl-CoA synthetase alpha subunit